MYEIVDINWERVNLHLKINKKIEEKIYLISDNSKIELKSKNAEVIINVTNTPEGTMLKDGVWQIFIANKPLKINENLLKILDDKSRIFPYRNDFYAYIVRLFIEDEELSLKIKTDFLMQNKKPEKFLQIKEAKNIKGFCKIIFQKIGIIGINTLYKVFHIFKKNNNVLFLSENSNNLEGNMKYVYNALTNSKYKISVFTINKYQKQNKLFYFLKEVYLIAKSKIIFLDNYNTLLTHIKVSKKTEIIQLWHAGIGFKSVGYARFGLKGSPHPYKSSHRKYTKAIVDTPELIDIYKEVFGCKEEIFLPVGIPRMQNFLDDTTIRNITEELYELNPNLETHKVILFAPTFRGEGHDDAYYDISKIDLDIIYKFCQNNNFIFIIKMHPFIKNLNLDLSKYNNSILDYSSYDINKLIYISDIMITDYSSCAYEYSKFNRPLIFYRYDKEVYEYLRPTHSVDLFTKNRYEAKTFKELMNILNSLNISIENRFKTKNNQNNKNIIESILGVI